jgi:hypothetical protein
MLQYNIKEFIELKDKYNSITLEQCQNTFNTYIDSENESPAKSITGFGDSKTCTLCISAKDGYNCNKCF